MALAAALSWAASAEAHRLRPGLRSSAPSQRALAQALAQSTGLAPSQVTTQDICGVAKPGYARCAAQAVVLRRNHALVRPHARHQATLGRVRQAFTPGFVTPAAAPGTAPGATTPAYLQQAYDLTYLSQTQGATDTIAIVDAYNNPNAESDLATYRSTFGLPACSTANGCFRKVNQTGGSTPPPTHDASWAEEESLDLDAVSALCPKCHILLVEAKTASVGDLDTAQIEAASLGANQISDSWTFAVSGGILGGTYVFPGISTVAATGDTGYLGNNSDNFPAAFSSVTAAGGTSLAAAGGGNPRGFSEGAWSLSGNMGGSSGCDLNVVKPSYQTDTGCFQRASGRTWGRAYADLSADADPATGLTIFDSEKGGWELIGGTSLSAPLIAAYYAITGVNSTTPQWAYSASTLLNDPISGSSGTCSIHYLCNAGPGYDGPTGVGSISGAVATGAPGIGGPANGTGGTSTYTQSTRPHGATIEGGIYPNGLDTKWWIEYSTDSSFDHASYVTDIGAGTAPVSVTGYLSHLTPGTTYHYHLVAQNSVGTTYGYDYTFTTPQASPSDPTASISAPSTATPGSVMFDASGSGSNDPQDSITDYTWDFGDGHTADSPSAVVSHTYAPGVYNVTLIVTDSNGDSDSTSQTITIDHLVASFTAPRIVAPGSTVSFDSSGSSDLLGPITDYSWDFGDGTTSDAGNNPTTTHPYPNRGNYVVMLTVTNKLGQTATTTQTVTVDVPPTASLAAPTGAQTPGSSLSFDASGSTPGPGGTITDYRFDFGDNSTPDDTQTTPNDTHTYANPGHYTATLTVTDDLGITTTATQAITVDAPPSAAFSASTDHSNLGFGFDATGSSDSVGTISTYSWDFGDGTTGSGATPTHTYPSRGPYTVTLTVTNDAGQQTTVQHDVVADIAPTASLSPSATVTTPGSSLSFDASGSTPGAGGTITDYRWDFGDNSTPDDTQTTPNDTHTYANPGHPTVTLTVTDDLGITTTVTQAITVDQPHASFSAPQSFVAPNTPASFDATGSSDPAGTIADYSWNFGDGTTGHGPSPTTTHAYAARGTYAVTLTVTNDSSQTDTTSAHTVTVDTAPTPAFSVAGAAQQPDSPVSFDSSHSAASSGGSITAYSWDYGDGSTDTGPNPSHSYASPGRYTVALTVTDDLGMTATISHTVKVDEVPTASFTTSSTPATLGPAVSFDGRGSSDSIGTITSYSWDFGDGATGSGATASHAYQTPGRYSITLTVTNDAGQTATTTRSITVDAAPSSSFSVSPNTARTGAPVGFNGGSSSDSVGTITSYSWNFGDGATAPGLSSSHTYAQPGSYMVALTVTNDAGQSATSTQTVTVYAPPSASFSASPSSTRTGVAVNFNAASSTDVGGTITGYSWNFGDGATAGGPSPTHAYGRPGTYTVTLTVTGSLGLATSTSRTVTVSPPPLSTRLSARKRQKLGTVLKSGLAVSVFTNISAKASFVVTMPVHAARQRQKHAKRVRKQTTTTVLRTAALSFAPGTHVASLKLSRATAAKLHASSKTVLTIDMVVTDIYGRTVGHSVKATISR